MGESVAVLLGAFYPTGQVLAFEPSVNNGPAALTRGGFSVDGVVQDMVRALWPVERANLSPVNPGDGLRTIRGSSA